MHLIEQATIRAFVVPAKRDRLTLLSSSQRRREGTELLNHFAHWDSRYAEVVRSSINVVALLSASGAGKECRLISDDPELDGRSLPLVEAVDAAEMSSFASVLCCVPGKLAFFFDEVGAPRRRLLLRRR